MAKIVITGCSDCPYFAKIELLAEKISINVPSFVFHKIVKTRSEWNEWVNSLIQENRWKIKESPIIWRELVDRGGKGHLIGGANEFQEYIKCYYNVMSDLTTAEMQRFALDNIKFKEEEDREIRDFKALSTPTKICICGSTNMIVPHFVISLASGYIIDETTELSIVFFDKSSNIPFLKSLQMGTFDLAFPLVRSISITEDSEAALTDSSYVIIFDEIIQMPDETLDDWLRRCQEYYEYLGNLLESYCPTTVKVLLVPDGQDNLINVNLTCMHRMLDRIHKFNVVGLSRPFEQHARSIVAKKLSVNPSNVHDIIVWGNLGGKMVFDITNSRVHKYDGSIVGPEPFSVSAVKTIWDKKWIADDMEILIQQRIRKISELRGYQGSPLAFSNALNSFLKHWINGDEKGYIHSLTVASEGRYGIPEGMVFSVPVTFHPKGYWTVVEDAGMTELQYKKIIDCIQDISEQVSVIYPWMTNTPADLILDEALIDSQLAALLEEAYPKERLGYLQNILNDALSVDQKLEISKNTELLRRKISELCKLDKYQSHEALQSQSSTDPPIETLAEKEHNENYINIELDDVDSSVDMNSLSSEDELNR